MPYEGEFAGYRPLQRITETERVRQLLRRARVHRDSVTRSRVAPPVVPESEANLPDFVIGIDGSYAEVDVRNGYPGAKVGYCTVASVLLNLREMDRLDAVRPVDPQAFRQTEQASTIDAALPGSNVVTRNHHCAQDSFRETLFDVFHDVIVDEEDEIRLLDTYEVLLAFKPDTQDMRCPYDYDDCTRHISSAAGVTSCPCEKRNPIYSTDALRIHEAFRDVGTNGEALGEVMQAWERVLLVHLLRSMECRSLFKYIDRLAFIVDGPLAMFGHPAWLSAAISRELKRINAIVQEETGTDLLILGIEKSGAFTTHFEELDRRDVFTEQAFPPRSYLMPTDRYIKERIIYSDSDKRYGKDTYFGRKFFYKTKSGARIVASIPFLTESQDTLSTDDIRLYPRFVDACAMLDKLASSRLPNAVTPIMSAHAQAAIPLKLGTKVLQQLAKALMDQDRG